MADTSELLLREKIAMKMVNPWVLQTIETCRAHGDWSHYLDVADAILALLPTATAPAPVDALTAENARLREALTKIRDFPNLDDPTWMQTCARAALTESKP